MPDNQPSLAKVKSEPGTVVPIPTYPLLFKNKTELAASPASPPGLRWKFSVELLSRLKVFAPAVVGTARDRLPEMVAVGLPPAILIKANLAAAVEVPPIKKSSVLLIG